MSDAARNIELVERLEQAYNKRDYDTVRACVAADFVAHTPGKEMVPDGVEGAIFANEGIVPRLLEQEHGDPRDLR